MAELVDALDLGSSTCGCEGSSPFFGTVHGVHIERDGTVALAELGELYDAVGWTSYTQDLQALERGITASPYRLVARIDGELVGFLRALSDFETITYVQDLLVHPDQRRKGVGRALLERCVEDLGQCRQFMLTTDPADSPDGARSHPLYRAVGMLPYEEAGVTGFMLQRRN